MSRRSSRALAARSRAPGFRPVISGTQFAEHVLLNFAGRAHGQVLDEDDADGHAPLGDASAIEGENLTFVGRAKSTGFSEARRRRRPSRRPQTETAIGGQRPGSSHRPTSRATNGHWATLKVRRIRMRPRSSCSETRSPADETGLRVLTPFQERRRATVAVSYSLSDLGPLTNGLSRR